MKIQLPVRLTSRHGGCQILWIENGYLKRFSRMTRAGKGNISTHSMSQNVEAQSINLVYEIQLLRCNGWSISSDQGSELTGLTRSSDLSEVEVPNKLHTQYVTFMEPPTSEDFDHALAYVDQFRALFEGELPELSPELGGILLPNGQSSIRTTGVNANPNGVCTYFGYMDVDDALILDGKIKDGLASKSNGGYFYDGLPHPALWEDGKPHHVSIRTDGDYKDLVFRIFLSALMEKIPLSFSCDVNAGLSPGVPVDLSNASLYESLSWSRDWYGVADALKTMSASSLDQFNFEPGDCEGAILII